MRRLSVPNNENDNLDKDEKIMRPKAMKSGIVQKIYRPTRNHTGNLSK